MSQMVQNSILVFCVCIIVIAFLMVILGTAQLQHGYIIDKEVYEPQYIDNVEGPILTINIIYKITIYNGIYSQNIIVDQETYENIKIGDYY